MPMALIQTPSTLVNDCRPNHTEPCLVFKARSDDVLALLSDLPFGARLDMGFNATGLVYLVAREVEENVRRTTAYKFFARRELQFTSTNGQIEPKGFEVDYTWSTGTPPQLVAHLCRILGTSRAEESRAHTSWSHHIVVPSVPSPVRPSILGSNKDSYLDGPLLVEELDPVPCDDPERLVNAGASTEVPISTRLYAASRLLYHVRDTLGAARILDVLSAPRTAAANRIQTQQNELRAILHGDDPGTLALQQFLEECPPSYYTDLAEYGRHGLQLRQREGLVRYLAADPTQHDSYTYSSSTLVSHPFILRHHDPHHQYSDISKSSLHSDLVFKNKGEWHFRYHDASLWIDALLRLATGELSSERLPREITDLRITNWDFRGAWKGGGASSGNDSFGVREFARVALWLETHLGRDIIPDFRSRCPTGLRELEDEIFSLPGPFLWTIRFHPDRQFIERIIANTSERVCDRGKESIHNSISSGFEAMTHQMAVLSLPPEERSSFTTEKSCRLIGAKVARINYCRWPDGTCALVTAHLINSLIRSRSFPSELIAKYGAAFSPANRRTHGDSFVTAILMAGLRYAWTVTALDAEASLSSEVLDAMQRLRRDLNAINRER